MIVLSRTANETELLLPHPYCARVQIVGQRELRVRSAAAAATIRLSAALEVALGIHLNLVYYVRQDCVAS
jgi:hypothetical protein